MLTIAGAGMAGLCAAARARELGLEAAVLEKGDRAGGSMLLSSGVVWRYRDLETFRAQCPGGDPSLQRLVLERLDDAVAWLESLGAPVVEHETGNPLTVGKRFDPHGLVAALRPDVRLREALPVDAEPPVLLATGGYPVALAARLGLLRRSNPWSEGDGLAFARARGGETAGDPDEFYGRAMPAPPARIRERDYVRLAQLYGRFADVRNAHGEAFFAGPPSWSETDLVQAIAEQPGGRAWFLLDDDALAERVRGLPVADMVAAAREAGGRVVEPGGLPFPAPPGTRVGVLVAPGVTHTIGGLRVDGDARVAGADGLYAAGADAGAIATGGYASGLASALVLALAAVEDVSR